MGEGSEQISESISAVEAVASRQPFSSCWESQSQVSLNVGDFLTIFSWFSQYPDEERKVWDHPSSSCLEERRHWGRPCNSRGDGAAVLWQERTGWRRNSLLSPVHFVFCILPRLLVAGTAAHQHGGMIGGLGGGCQATRSTSVRRLERKVLGREALELFGSSFISSAGWPSAEASQGHLVTLRGEFPRDVIRKFE